MRQIERDYTSGRIGITDEGELVPLRDIYEDMSNDARPTDYHIAPQRDLDRSDHHNCRHCGTVYRGTEQRDPARCPFCWRLV
jgi:rubrerythrin